MSSSIQDIDKSLRVLYCRSITLSSVLIRAADRWGQWSHCALYVPTKNYVIESRAFHGVVRTPIREFLDRSSQFDFHDIEVPNPQAGIEFAEAQVGKGYDYGAVVGNLIREELHSNSRMNCNELVESSVMAAGRNRFHESVWKLSPNLSYKVK